MTAVGAWPVPWDPYGRRGSVARPLGSYGRREDVAGYLGPIWPPWKRGRSSGPCMAAIRAWPVYLALYSRRWGLAEPLGPDGRREGVAGPLAPLWPPWRRGLSPGSRMAAVEAWPVPWAPYGRCGAWMVYWAPYGCRGVVAKPLGRVWPPWGCGRSPGHRMAAVGAWPVPWAPHVRCGAWLIPWALYGRRGAVAIPLVLVWPLWGVVDFLGLVWPPWGRGRSPWAPYGCC